MSQMWIDPASPTRPDEDVAQAGFVRRWAALFLDQLILGAGFYALLFTLILVFGLTGGLGALENMDSDNPPAWVIGAYLGMMLLYYVGAGLYFSLMESSRHQATLGKMALGIKVVSSDGGRLTFAHALGRWFAASLSYLTFYIGFLMAAFTQKKQALHDMVASTFVVDKWAYTDFPERQQRGMGGCGVAFLIGMVLLIALCVTSVLAAIALPAYQQYRARSQFAQVQIQLGQLRTQVANAAAQDGHCPTNATPGFATPESYAGAGISRIVVDEFEEGFCGISVWMPPALGTTERQFLAELDPQDGLWYCTNKAGDVPTPEWCR